MQARDRFKPVDPRLIVVDKQHNPRDFSLQENKDHLATIKASIKARGIDEVLWVRTNPKDETKPILIDGETRLRAVLELIAEGDDIKKVPVEYKDGTNDIERLVLALVANSGKPLNQLECGTAFKKLVAKGWEAKQIAETVGKTQNFVTRSIEIANLPEDVKTLVADGQVSALKAINTVKAEGDGAGTVLQTAIAAQTPAPSPKASGKNVDKPAPLKNERVMKTTKLHDEVTALYEWCAANGVEKSYNVAINKMPVGSSEIPDSITFAVPITCLCRYLVSCRLFTTAKVITGDSLVLESPTLQPFLINERNLMNTFKQATQAYRESQSDPVTSFYSVQTKLETYSQKVKRGK